MHNQWFTFVVVLVSMAAGHEISDNSWRKRLDRLIEGLRKQIEEDEKNK